MRAMQGSIKAIRDSGVQEDNEDHSASFSS